MTCTDWTRSLELTFSPMSLTEVDRWLRDWGREPHTVPLTVRYRHHPRISPSNPQLPVTKCHQLFTGHKFRVGRSKK